MLPLRCERITLLRPKHQKGYSDSMGTTLTLDDDVAAMVERLRKRSGASTTQIVNDALRRGLAQIALPVPARTPYRTPSTSLGRCLPAGLDDIAEVLAVTEGESFR